MKCIHSATGKQLLDKIYAGQCEIHAASKTLVGKAFRSDFLLANNKERWSRIGPEVRSVPVPIKATALTRLAYANYPSNLAFCMLGTRYDRVVQKSSGRIYSRARHYQ